MTPKGVIQLAEARKDIKYMKERLDKLDVKLDQILVMLDEQEKRENDYITKKGLWKFTGGAVGLTLSLATLFYLIYDHVKGGVR